MMGLDGSFGEYVAFFVGLSMGAPGCSLKDFGEWIASRSDSGGWNLAWPVLVLREAGFESWVDRDWHHLGPEEDARAVSKLSELLGMFLELRT